MNAREQLLLEYEELMDESSRAGELCPACKGGDTGEGSLSVSRREGRLLWVCHRASCGFSGGSSSNVWRASGRTEAVSCRGTVGRTYIRSSVCVPPETCSYLEQRYAITSEHLRRAGVGWDEREQRVVIPVRGLQGQEFGANLRSLSGAIPKSMLHAESSSISFYPNRKSKDLIIVEDQWSALRASDYLNAVALLGTYIDDERAYQLKAGGFSRLFLALDNDAWDKTVKYCVKYRSLLGLIPVKISKDLKDMSPQELEELVCSIL